MALNNPRTGAVYRRQGNLVFRGGGDLTGMRGGFIPDLVGLDVPPGTYRMEGAGQGQAVRKAGTIPPGGGD